MRFGWASRVTSEGCPAVAPAARAGPKSGGAGGRTSRRPARHYNAGVTNGPTFTFGPEDAELVRECRKRALALLRANLGPAGLLAATPSPQTRERRYDAVFARDAAVCALAMLRSGAPDLIEGVRTGLRSLAAHQAANGQVPKFFHPERPGADFWYIGCIDSTLWWLIALDEFDRCQPDCRLKDELQEHIRRAVVWLQCQEHPQLCLLTQNEASDWADIMPRSGFVLYSNTLWHHVKQRYALPGCQETAHHFNHLFFPFTDDLPEYRRLRLLGQYVRNLARHRDLYLSFVNFSFWGEEGDVLGNLLAVLLGLADEVRARSIVGTLTTAGIDAVWPVRAVCRPFAPGSPFWRTYMERHRQNLAWQYHNGGCWPFIGGFWVMTLAALGEHERASAALVQLARANAVDGWAFPEWFHGQTGEARGMRGQSWSAAMLLLALDGLGERVFPAPHPITSQP